MHVDDLCLTIVEDIVDEVLNEAKGIVDFAINEFTTKEGLPFADDKTFVFASTFQLAKNSCQGSVTYSNCCGVGEETGCGLFYSKKPDEAKTIPGRAQRQS